MGVRDAPAAGISELISPMAQAVRMHTDPTAGSSGGAGGRNWPAGLRATPAVSPAVRKVVDARSVQSPDGPAPRLLVQPWACDRLKLGRFVSGA